MRQAFLRCRSSIVTGSPRPEGCNRILRRRRYSAWSREDQDKCARFSNALVRFESGKRDLAHRHFHGLPIMVKGAFIVAWDVT